MGGGEEPIQQELQTSRPPTLAELEELEMEDQKEVDDGAGVGKMTPDGTSRTGDKP